MLRTATRTLKFQVLERRLGSRILAAGVLELLWHTTAENAPDGGIGRFTDEEIEVAIGWTGEPGALVAMLVDTKWLDRVDGDARLYVHDWHDHADRSVHMRLARETRLFANGAMPTLGHLPKEERPLAEQRYADESKRTARTRRVHGTRSKAALLIEGQGQVHRPGAEARSRGQEQEERDAPHRVSSDAAEPAPDAPAPGHDLAVEFADLIRAGPVQHAKIPQRLDRWARSLDRLERIDKVPREDIRAVMRWATSHAFWASNVLSADTLREKFPRLHAQMQRERGSPPARAAPSHEDTVKAALAAVERQERDVARTLGGSR